MTHEPEQQRSTTRRHAAIGVSAGLLAGGAIGLMVAMPGFSSAADDASAPAIGAAVEQDTEPTLDETRPEPGEHLREVLEELVADGTLTSDQADTVAEHLMEHRAERGDGGPRGQHGPHGHRGPGPGADGEVIAELLGIDAETLRDELRSGNSIADIAAANGVDVQVVVDALVDAAEEHLDLAVENGRLTAEEAAEKADQLEERITARVNGERPERPAGPGAALDG
jgi:polyhydroxyalkanoate synthesis regulator phasin